MQTWFATISPTSLHTNRLMMQFRRLQHSLPKSVTKQSTICGVPVCVHVCVCVYAACNQGLSNVVSVSSSSSSSHSSQIPLHRHLQTASSIIIWSFSSLPSSSRMSTALMRFLQPTLNSAALPPPLYCLTPVTPLKKGSCLVWGNSLKSATKSQKDER